MPSIIERIADWRSRPSRAELAATVANLEHEITGRRFKRYNPVPSGVPITYGQFEYEQTKALTGTDKWDKLDQLSLDPHVKGALRNVTLPLVNADWEMVPASDTPRDEEIAEFVSANLLRKGGDKYGSEYYLKTPWKAHRIREILDMLESGFSMFAKSTKIVNGKRVYDRLQFLEPSSVDPRGWILNDADEIEEIQRTFRSPSGKMDFQQGIPVDQLLLYVWDLKGARFEGRPFTRSMFGAWMRKEFKQRMSAILAQKLGAPVPYGWYPPGFPPDAIPAFKQFVQGLRGTSPAEAYMVGPQGTDGKSPDVGYAGAEHNIDRGFNDSIHGDNMEIAHAGGNTSASLGEGSSGSRALGDSKGLTEMVMVEAVAEIIGEFETHGVGNLPGPIQELVDWNFAGVTNYPRLVASKINPFAIQNSWDQLVKAWEAGIIPKSPESRRQIVETHLGLNLPDEQYDVEVPPPLAGPFNAPSNPDDESESPAAAQVSPPEDDEDGAGGNSRSLSLESAEAFRKRIAHMLEPMEDAPTGGKFRGRNRLEATVCDLGAVQGSFRVGERDFLLELRTGHRAMIEDLMQRLRAGKISTRNIEGQRRSVFKGAKKARNRVVRVFKRTGETAFDHVVSEIGRQADAT